MGHYAMLRVIAIWAAANFSAIVFFAALFLVEQKPRRRRRSSGPIIPISRR